MSECSPASPAAYPFPQLVLTLGHERFHLEIAGEAEPILVDARDTEALLAVVGRWALAARNAQEIKPNV
jgi:hypothetical protein